MKTQLRPQLDRPATPVAATRCPYCHDDVRSDEAVAVCEVCLARHHASCWSVSCASCGQTRALRASEAAPGTVAIDLRIAGAVALALLSAVILASGLEWATVSGIRELGVGSLDMAPNLAPERAILVELLAVVTALFAFMSAGGRSGTAGWMARGVGALVVLAAVGVALFGRD